MRAIGMLLAASTLVAQPLPRKQVIEEMRIDATAEDLPDVSGFRVGPSGQVALYVHHDAHLRFYDANGRRMGIFGRKGRGPGEFEGYSQFGWIADTLWLYDPRQLRVTYISPTLKLARIEVVDHLNKYSRGNGPIGAIGSFSPEAIVNDRYIGAATVVFDRPANVAMPAPAQRILSIPRRGGNPDSLHGGGRYLADVPSWASISVQYQSARYSSSTIVPFAFYPRVVFSPDGSRFAVVSPDTAATPRNYTITLLSIRGDTLFRRTYPNNGERIPPRVSDSALAERMGNNPVLVGRGRARMPKVYPALNQSPNGLILGRDGSMWLQTWPNANGSLAIALDGLGKPMFEVRLPPRTTLTAATASTLWTEQDDDDGLTSVVRFRVR